MLLVCCNRDGEREGRPPAGVGCQLHSERASPRARQRTREEEGGCLTDTADTDSDAAARWFGFRFGGGNGDGRRAADRQMNAFSLIHLLSTDQSVCRFLLRLISLFNYFQTEIEISFTSVRRLILQFIEIAYSTILSVEHLLYSIAALNSQTFYI